MPYTTSLKETVGDRPSVLVKGLMILVPLGAVTILVAEAYSKDVLWKGLAYVVAVTLIVGLLAFVLYLRERSRNQHLLLRIEGSAIENTKVYESLVKAQDRHMRETEKRMKQVLALTDSAKAYTRRDPSSVPFELITTEDQRKKELEEIEKKTQSGYSGFRQGHMDTESVYPSTFSPTPGEVRYIRSRRTGEWIDTWSL